MSSRYPHFNTYNNYWITVILQVSNNSVLFLDPTSLVMSICFELSQTMKMVTILWRFVFDNRLSVMLAKLANVDEKLANLNVVRPLNRNCVLLFSIGAAIHFTGHCLKPINHILYLPNFPILYLVTIKL